MRCNLTAENTVILACDSMLTHIKAAQEKMKTDFPVVELRQELHAVPEKMREEIIAVLEDLPESVDTVLVAMGYCGGSWKDIEARQQLVIPKVDDCITLLLHTDHVQHDNLKAQGHMYFRDDVESDSRLSIKGILNGLIERFGEKRGRKVFDTWFDAYGYADIIDTGVYDCHGAKYSAKAKESAELIGCQLVYTKGSNIILEKLVSQQWDDQFVVCAPGTVLRMQDFMKCLELIFQ